ALLLLLARLAGAAVVRLLDGVDQLALLHRRASADVELARDVHEVRLRGVRIDPARGVAVRPAPGLGGLLVGRALAALRLPVVAHLLVGVLERGERDPAGAATVVAVGLDRRVVAVHPGAPGLGVRALDGARHRVLARHVTPPLDGAGAGCPGSAGRPSARTGPPPSSPARRWPPAAWRRAAPRGCCSRPTAAAGPRPRRRSASTPPRRASRRACRR